VQFQYALSQQFVANLAEFGRFSIKRKQSAEVVLRLADELGKALVLRWSSPGIKTGESAAEVSDLAALWPSHNESSQPHRED
jgi:hypothetical protein